MNEKPHTPISLEELKKKHRDARNIQIEYKEKLTKMEKLAVWITERVGSMGFFLIIFIWTTSWLLWNAFGPETSRFDPYPAFVLWLFISNMIQLLLMPLIMVGQNLQGRHSEARAEADFELNIKAEHEIETILEHLENQQKILLSLQEKTERTN
jgi:uncharacterized membrane protein